MKQSEFGKDTGLQARMGLTVFLLGLVYVVLIAVAVTAGLGIVGVLVIFAALSAAQLFAADKIALQATGAHEVSAAQAPGCTRSSIGSASRRTSPSHGSRSSSLRPPMRLPSAGLRRRRPCASPLVC